MHAAILGLSLLLFAYLLRERRQVDRARARLAHVVHVNGTRGKSTVSRLIDAGLRAGGYAVFCKTTGTDPMTIDVTGAELPVHRRGATNIKEQLQTLLRADAQGAQVLVVECMAIRPELQHAAQHDMLRADVGVITNVRRDHTDVMGESPEEICDALANSIPAGGTLFTAERRMAARLEEHCARLGSTFVAAYPDGSEPAFDFPENLALALAVCEHLGVARETALAGMTAYRPDPYALSVFRMGADLLVNGLSINDVASTCMVYSRLREQLSFGDRPLVLLINNRADRGSRTQDMLTLCARLAPDEVWLTGASLWYMRRGLARILPQAQVRILHGADDAPFSQRDARVVFAVGNIANEGKRLMARAEREGERIV